DNAFEEYNPWGRPGAGAPIRTQSGTVLADYYHRAVKEHAETTRQDNVVIASVLQTSVSSHGPTTTYQTRPTPVATVGSSTSNVDTDLPVALRSSFAVGAPGLVTSDTQQRKRQEELKWKQDLEIQIEEKKERERQRKWKEEQEDLLNLSWNNKHTRPPPQNPTPSHVIDAPSMVSDVQQQKANPDLTLTQGSQDVTSPLLNAALDGSLNKTHARGFGMYSMDPQSKTEADKKRLKMLEHQRAIQEQVEENRRRKQQERELRLKEEAVEEARLAKERDFVNQTFATEQRRKKEKEEEAKRVSEALQQSVLDAYEAAQQVSLSIAVHSGSMLALHEYYVPGTLSPFDCFTTGAGASRSYVVSRGSSLAHQVVSDNGSQDRHDNRQSTLSNYPRIPARETPKNKSHGRTSKANQSISSRNEPFVPPLDLVRVESPPIPTLRNKIQQVKPPSHRSTTPTSVKHHIHRAVSSQSEPCDVTQRDSHRSQLESILSSHDEMTSARFLPEEATFPFDTIEDAFMIPYHRTDSATLPAPPETPEESAEEKPAKTKGIDAKKNSKKLPAKDGSTVTVTPMYRSYSTRLKPEKAETQASPRRMMKGIKPLQTAKRAPSPRGVAKRSLKGSTSRSITQATVKDSTSRSVSQPRGKHDVESNRKVKDQVSPRVDALSRHSAAHQVSLGF
ncbi:hypothetical protein QZH41_011195, partial [Actinostola sp. cb2023]